MAQGRPPLIDMHPLRALLEITSECFAPRLNSNENWSDKIQSFLQFCFIKDPKVRPSAKELLQHPFIRAAGKRQIIRNYLKRYKKDVYWGIERIIWIGFYKNDDNDQCFIGLIAKDVLLYIIDFLCGVNPLIQVKRHPNSKGIR